MAKSLMQLLSTKKRQLRDVDRNIETLQLLLDREMQTFKELTIQRHDLERQLKKCGNRRDAYDVPGEPFRALTGVSES